MKNSAFVSHAHIRNVVLCSLLTLGLAACGADEGSGSATASTAADPIPSLVSPNIGVVDRSSETGIAGTAVTGETNLAANTTQSATPVSPVSPVLVAAPTSGSTTVASTKTP